MTKIFADSTCDLSQELIARYDVTIVPLHTILDQDDYLDGVTITPDEIYAWSDKHKTTPKTSALNIEEVIAKIKPVLDAGDDIIFFTISASMSTTINVIKMAAEELDAADRVRVIDSANLSTGIGLQIIAAAEMLDEGKSAADVVDEIEAIKPKVRASFVVDTLVYLYRGGRCSGLAAMAGGVLKLHPKIVVENGAMHPDKKYRGRIGRAILNYVKDMEADILTARPEHIFITHSGCDQELIDEIKTYLENTNHFKEIHITRAGSVISSHCGPGTLGVLYIAG